MAQERRMRQVTWDIAFDVGISGAGSTLNRSARRLRDEQNGGAGSRVSGVSGPVLPPHPPTCETRIAESANVAR